GPDPPDEWSAAFARVRSACTDDPDLLLWFDDTFAGRPPVSAKRLRLRDAHLGFHGTHLHLNADEFGVADVAAAARLCDRILCYGGGGNDYVFWSVEGRCEGGRPPGGVGEEEGARHGARTGGPGPPHP